MTGSTSAAKRGSGRSSGSACKIPLGSDHSASLSLSLSPCEPEPEPEPKPEPGPEPETGPKAAFHHMIT